MHGNMLLVYIFYNNIIRVQQTPASNSSYDFDIKDFAIRRRPSRVFGQILYIYIRQNYIYIYIYIYIYMHRHRHTYVRALLSIYKVKCTGYNVPGTI